jgi:peptidoglycan/xylan/chitin deacetylase (PgdA/CDA1 family)
VSRLARRSLKVVSGAFDRLRVPEPGVVILLYHRVGGTTTLDVDLEPGVFDDQMALLQESGAVVSLEEALERLTANGVTRPGPSIVVTFDDGTADFADVAMPIMQRHDIPVTLYVATAFVEEGRHFPENGLPLSWSALADVRATGLVNIGSHTHNHRLLDRVSEIEAGDELDRSIDVIGHRLGIRPRDFAYPKAVAGCPAAARAVAVRFRSAALAGTRANPYGATDPQFLSRSPIQVSDGMRWFQRKVAGGMAFEDALRRSLNRVRYSRSTT